MIWVVFGMSDVTVCNTVHINTPWSCCYCIYNFCVFFLGHVRFQDQWPSAAVTECRTTRIGFTHAQCWWLLPRVRHSLMKCGGCLCNMADWCQVVIRSILIQRKESNAPAGVPHTHTHTETHTQTCSWKIRWEETMQLVRLFTSHWEILLVVHIHQNFE